jgi:putative transposase
MKKKSQDRRQLTHSQLRRKSKRVLAKRRYAVDLTDAQWALIQPLLQKRKQKGPGGRPRIYPLRDILDALLYVLRGGIAWRLLPNDYPRWQNVYAHFRRWIKDGTLERIHGVLRKWARRAQRREDSPSAMVIDSQSVPTTEASHDKGYDAGKKIDGRKRHIVVDTLGLIWAVTVHAANIQDAPGARLVLPKLAGRVRRLKTIFADQIYRGTLAIAAYALGGWKLSIVERPKDQKGFVLLPKRWTVERTFAWLGKCRRLSKDYERLASTSEAWIHLAMIALIARRLRSF